MSEQIVQTEKKKKSKFKSFLISWIPYKGDSAGEVIRKIIVLIALVVFIVSGVYLGMRFAETNKNQKMYNEIESMVIKDDELTWDDIYKMYPDVDFPEGMQLKYAHLYAANQDFVGYLTIPNSTVAVPVVQGRDNDYYLRRDYYKKSTRYGNPYLDYRNSIKPLDFNEIIYGHNMKDGQIFGQLLDMYKDAENFKKYPVIEFNTLYEDYKWVVVGAFYINGNSDDDNQYLFPFNTPNMDDGDKAELYRGFEQRMLYTTSAWPLDADDHLLTLTTCSYNFHDARFIIVARQLRDGETIEDFDTSKVTVNPSPRYPQVWYDKNGKENPYKNEDRWYPRAFKAE